MQGEVEGKFPKLSKKKHLFETPWPNILKANAIKSRQLPVRISRKLAGNAVCWFLGKLNTMSVIHLQSISKEKRS